MIPIGYDGEVWFRYEEFLMQDRVIVQRREFPVVRHTPKGVQLDIGLGTTRLVLHGSHKKFACATDAEARHSFKARKRRQGLLLERQLATVKAALVAIDSEMTDGLVPRWEARLPVIEVKVWTNRLN